MACGCSEACNCYLEDSETVSMTGTGTSADPYIATVIPDPEGGLQNTADGVAIKLDPASGAPVSIGPDGLKVDCCGDDSAVEDTESVNLSMALGTITADVILDPEAGLELTGDGVGVKVDPASTATVSVGVDGLRVDLPASEVVAQAWDVGDFKPTARVAATPGWLLCDGSAVSIAAQPNLFAVIGHSYGADPGGGNFLLPDGRGRAFVGLGTHADVNAIGENDGLAVGSRTPVHTHSDGSLATSTDATGLSIVNNTTGIAGTGNNDLSESGIGGGATQAVWDDVAIAAEPISGTATTGTINQVDAAANPHAHAITDGGHGHGTSDAGHDHDVTGATGSATLPYFVGNWLIKT